MRVQTINEAFELQSKKRKKKKKTYRLVLLWLKSVLMLALIIATLVFAALSPLFDVRYIEVNGAGHYKSEDIKVISGLNTGENGFKLIGSNPGYIFKLRIGSAEKLLQQKCPYIKDVKVRFAVPSTVVIDMTERSAYVVVQYHGTSLVLDREGYVLETAASDKEYNLPFIGGLKFKNFKTGSMLVMENPEAFNTALKVLDVIKAVDGQESVKLYGYVDAVDAGDRRNVCISLDGRIVVNLGDLLDLNYRISVAKTVFIKDIKKDAKGKLDFTVGENPVFEPESE